MSRSLNSIAFFVALMMWLQAAASAQKRPNIVLIVADDIGFSDFGAFLLPPKVFALRRSVAGPGRDSACVPGIAQGKTGKI